MDSRLLARTTKWPVTSGCWLEQMNGKLVHNGQPSDG
jgi:hypothetical protein